MSDDFETQRAVELAVWQAEQAAKRKQEEMETADKRREERDREDEEKRRIRLDEIEKHWDPDNGTLIATPSVRSDGRNSNSKVKTKKVTQTKNDLIFKMAVWWIVIAIIYYRGFWHDVTLLASGGEAAKIGLPGSEWFFGLIFGAVCVTSSTTGKWLFIKTLQCTGCFVLFFVGLILFVLNTSSRTAQTKPLTSKNTQTKSVTKSNSRRSDTHNAIHSRTDRGHN